MNGLKRAQYLVDRKMLAEMAVNDEAGFKTLAGSCAERSPTVVRKTMSNYAGRPRRLARHHKRQPGWRPRLQVRHRRALPRSPRRLRRRAGREDGEGPRGPRPVGRGPTLHPAAVITTPPVAVNSRRYHVIEELESLRREALAALAAVTDAAALGGRPVVGGGKGA